MNRATVLRWFRRLIVAVAAFVFLILFVVLPVGGSFLITNSRFRFRERGAADPLAFGLSVTPAEFNSSDGVPLRGWWSAGDPAQPVIIFSHGLSRSRVELLERAAESNRRGYGVLLFDLRNHGESGEAYTTLGIHESRDVCGAGDFAKEKAAGRPQILWGVSLGAASALLGAKRCPGFAAVISDSSFLSIRETVGRHLRLIFGLPAFPFANLIVAITELRMGFDADEGDVEAAVREIDAPILFVAGGADRRMPPVLAERMLNAARNSNKQLLVIPAAGHGQAFSTDRETYLNSVYRFVESLRYNPVSSQRTGGS
jgi:pimeloyl-ACP methyl ester carboxylesterase